MDYDQAFEHACGETYSRAIAFGIVLKHGATWAEFLEDCGDKPEYKGDLIFGWLGY